MYFLPYSNSNVRQERNHIQHKIKEILVQGTQPDKLAKELIDRVSHCTDTTTIAKKKCSENQGIITVRQTLRKKQPYTIHRLGKIKIGLVNYHTVCVKIKVSTHFL